MAPKRRKSSSSRKGNKKKDKGAASQSSVADEGVDHPDDIFPLLLTSATQKLFSVLTDEDVTDQRPFKLLKKDNIIQDIKKNAALSDFSPAKQLVLDYPEEEILLVFDSSFTYGHSFYLVLTPEAKNRILNPLESVTPEVSEKEVDKTPKQWISLGSEKEIDEESVKETREKIQIKFQLPRTCRLPVNFSNRSAKDSFMESVSCEDNRFSIKPMQRDCSVQNVSKIQDKSSQTHWAVQMNSSIQYSPKELSQEQIESLLQSESLKNFLKTVTPRMLYALQDAEIGNVFTDDWKELGTELDVSDGFQNLVICRAFKDQKYTKNKKISSINWHPTISGVIAVALMEKREEQSDETSRFNSGPGFIVFYSFSDSNPQLVLESPEDIVAFEFCPSNPNIIVGGSFSGQVVLWDISAHNTNLKGAQSGNKKSSDNSATFSLFGNKESKTPVERFCAVSAVERSHTAPITDVQWLPQTFEVTNMGLPVENKLNLSVQVVSCSPDCTILFWDVRQPQMTEQASLDKKQNVDQKTLTMTCKIPQTFKHLDKTWKPLLKINTTGEYVPLKFNLEPYTGNDTGIPSKDGRTENIPDYSQLRVPSDGKIKKLKDVNTKFFVGTEDGEVVYTDWKLERDVSGRLYSVKPLLRFSSHPLMVNSVQRSPFFKDIILTTGGWNFAIWKEGVMGGPLLESPRSDQECTVGCWSQSRPAVFFIGKEDGSVEVWNLLKNTSEPSLIQADIISTKITCLKPWIASSKQHFLAVTDVVGVLHVFEIPKTLWIPSELESSNMKSFFELQTDVMKDYYKKEERWDNEKVEEPPKKKEADKPVIPLIEHEEADMKEYHNALMLEERILKSMGLWPTALDTK